jgi:hypothetical protein
MSDERVEVLLCLSNNLRGEVLALRRELAESREALLKIATDDWANGGRALKGNEKLPGCERFYAGYNAGIDAQFEKSSGIARAALGQPEGGEPNAEA